MALGGIPCMLCIKPCIPVILGAIDGNSECDVAVAATATALAFLLTDVLRPLLLLLLLLLLFVLFFLDDATV